MGGCSSLAYRHTQTTKIGQIVGKLRASSHADIAARAKALVQGWKAVIDKERAAKGGSSTAASSNGGSKANSVATTPKAGTTTASPNAPSPAASASPATPSASASAAAAASANATPPNFDILKEKTRNTCLKLIFDALKLAEIKEVSDSTLFGISLDVEKSVFDKMCGADAVAVNQEYRNKMRSLSLNLKDKKNPQFRRRVVRGEIPGGRLVDLTPAVSTCVARELQSRLILALLAGNGLRGASRREPQSARAEHARSSKRC